MGRRVGRFLLVCAFAALVVGGITLRNAAIERQAELDSLVAEVEAAGYTVDPSRFQAAYRDGMPEPNAANVYLEALTLLNDGDTDAAIERTIRAAGIDRSRFPLQFRQEASIPFEYPLLQDLSQALSDRIREILAGGDRESARQLLEAQFALAESLNEAPLLLMQALRFNLLRRALDDLAATMEAGVLDKPWLGAIESVLAGIELNAAMIDAMAAERTATYAATAQLGADRGAIGRALDGATGAQHALQRGVLAAYRELIAALEAPAHFRTGELERLAAMPASMGAIERQSAEAIIRAAMRIIALTTEMEGMLAAARGACMVERYRLEQGTLPQSEAELAQAGMALPDDPLGGGRIRYRSMPAGGYRLWSVGRDGLDDGGESDSADVVFVVGARQ